MSQYVRWRAYSGRDLCGGVYCYLWLWGGRGIKVKRRDALLFSDRYVWPKVRVGRYFIVFYGFGSKERA